MRSSLVRAKNSDESCSISRDTWRTYGAHDLWLGSYKHFALSEQRSIKQFRTALTYSHGLAITLYELLFSVRFWESLLSDREPISLHTVALHVQSLFSIVQIEEISSRFLDPDCFTTRPGGTRWTSASQFTTC